MNAVPIKSGKNCVFRVVRVSGTIRKAEEEAIQRAKALILKARREIGEQSSTLDNIFGKGDDHTESTKDSLIVDREDSDEEDEELSDGV